VFYGAAMTERVTVAITDGVADVRLNRPDKMNALDGEMFRALLDTGAALAADRSVRAVVLSGEGRGFCAGLDFGGFMAMAGDDSGDGGGVNWIGQVPEGAMTHNAQQACWVWREMPAPVIAAMHGVALGGGIQLALAADLRIVAPDARLSVLESRWGISPDMTATVTLVELVGLDRAKELALTGRMVSGTEAVEIGLATRLAHNPRAEAMELARQIAGRSPHAMQAIKRLLNASPHRPPADSFAHERAEIGALIGSPNQVEAVTAYFEQRPPDFADPTD
jgi:enoyl-CoA hydratase/carnithine racemase